MYTSRDRPKANRRESYFHLEDKHLYTTSCMEFMLDLVTKFKENHKVDVKGFSDMIFWYVQVHKLLLCFMPKIYEVQKRITNWWIMVAIDAKGEIVEYLMLCHRVFLCNLFCIIDLGLSICYYYLA